MASAGRRGKIGERARAVVALVAMAAAMVAWCVWYVLPRDRLMADTQTCVEGRINGVNDTGRYQAERKAWAKCWAEVSENRDWVWSDVSRPRRQGDPR